jgi:uncharacterized protein YeaO (DUF488 family)
MQVELKRIYDPPSPNDGLRVLVDRLWPRGLTKEQARVDIWLRDVAPSHELRRWFDHRPERLEEFIRRYREELNDPEHRAALQRLRELAKQRPVTLLFSAKEAKLSHAAILAELLLEQH